MVWEQMPRGPEERYRLGLMTPEERWDYERQRSLTGFEEAASVEAQAVAQEQAAAAGAAEQARMEERMRQDPTGVHAAAEDYRRKTGNYPANYTPQTEPSLEQVRFPRMPGEGLLPPMEGLAPTEALEAPPTSPLDEERGDEKPPAPMDGPPRRGRVSRKFPKLISDYKTRLGDEEAAYKEELGKIGGEEGEVFRARKALGEAKSALSTATDSLKGFKIDPNRAFPTAFSKIAAVISVAMGAYAQGLSGGKLPNTALDIINSSIKNDIDAQKVEFEKLKGLVDEKRNVYAMGMRLLGNAQEAEHFTKKIAFQVYQGKLDQVGKQMGLQKDLFNLEAEENYQEGLLYNARIKNSARKREKLPKEMMTAASTFDSTTTTMTELWKNAGGFTFGPISGFFQKYIIPGEEKADTFDRASEQAVLEMVHAISGVAVRKDEFDRIRNFYPSSLKNHSTNRARMIGAVEWALKKGAGHYKILTPEQKAYMRGTVPQLSQLYETPNKKARERIIVGMFQQQSMAGDFGTGLGGETVMGR